MPANTASQQRVPQLSSAETARAELEKPLHPERENIDTSFGEVLDLWLSSAAFSLKPSTYSTYFSIVENHIRPRLGDTKTGSLKDSHIERFMTELVSGEPTLSGSTARGISNVLRSVIVFAARHGCRFLTVSAPLRARTTRAPLPSSRACPRCPTTT